MRVLIADKFEASGLAGLKEAGCDVVYQPDLKDAALVDAIRDTAAEVLVVRGTPVTAPMLEAGSLSLVVRAGAGYNTIDVAAASRRGIYVANCPGRNAVAVAELAMALILAIDRRIPENVADLRAGTWNKKEYSNARGLFGRTLGLIGYGSIAREVAVRAHAFGIRTIAWSRRFSSGGAAHPPDADPFVEAIASPEEVAERSDVLSVHLALSPATRQFVSRSILEKLKPGAYFINTARAEVVDHAALEDVVRERGIKAGLDVFDAEPPGTTSVASFAPSIVALPGVYGTHHIGGSTEQAQEAIAAETVRIVVSYQTAGKVPNAVNLATKTPATHRLIVRHRDRPGVLAGIFDQLRANQINVQETENIVFEGAEAAMVSINLDAAPSESLVSAIRAGVDILDVRVVTIQ
jgi:D-3-phosphoglycerate dehydrogenase